MTLRGTMQVNELGHLAIGDCDVVDLALHYGTPLYVYDEIHLRDIIRSFHAAFIDRAIPYALAYATKAFCTVAMCQLAHEEGCLLDVVSGGELYTALRAGVPAQRIHLHGNNKTYEELSYAVTEGIGAIIVDNFHELTLLRELTECHGTTMDVLIRVAPGVSAHTHDYISTGQQDSKFGFDLPSGQVETVMRQLLTVPTLRCIGVHAHIGSQIFDSRGFALSIERLVDVYQMGQDLGLPLEVINAGGGFGIRYTAADEPASIDDLVGGIIAALQMACQARNLALPQIWIEPGRSIAGPAGSTLYTVGSQKLIPDVRNYVSVDGGMTDNPRLALYQAEYEAALANRMEDESAGAWSVAGKCCESGDMLIWDAQLPAPQPGDILAVFATGAYNYSMASHYNRIPKAAVVFVRKGEATVVVARETWADVVRHDRPLPHLDLVDLDPA